MIRFAISLAIALLTVGVSYAIDPIDDSGKYQIAVIGDCTQAPATWFDSHPGLKALKAKVHFVCLNESSELYKQRYASIVSGTKPIVLFEQPDGGVVYASAAETMPATPDAMFEALKHHYRLAINAVPASQATNSFPEWSNESQSQCVDGQCKPVDQNSNFPRLDGWLHPFEQEQESVKSTLTVGAILVIAFVLVVLFVCVCVAVVAFALAAISAIRFLRGV